MWNPLSPAQQFATAPDCSAAPVPQNCHPFGQPQNCKLIKAVITQSASCIHLQPVLGRFLNKCPLVLSQGHCSCLSPAWIAVVASACARRLSTQPVGLQGQYIS